MTIAFHASSQDACGVTGVPDPQYFQNLSPTSDQLTLKLYFNIIRDDNENFGYDQTRIPLIINEIEKGFLGTDIHFEFVCDVQIIDESDLVTAGTNLTSPTGGICTYDDQTTWIRHTDGIDIFINQNGNGSGPGIASSIPGKYAVIKEDSGPANTLEGTTIVHELGHLFGLMHMHRGQNNIPYHYPNGFCGNYSGGLVNLNQCTDYECADAFSYVCGLGFVQDEAACAEHRSGPAEPIGEFSGNGKIAGDLIPDTPPSHSLAERSLTACAPDNTAIIVSENFPSGVYSYEVKDISGSQFQPDITNYMSIIKDKTCRNHFTEDQIEVMKNHIRSHPLLSNFHSTKGQLACDCDYENIIYLRENVNWSQVIIDQEIDPNQLSDYEIVVEETLTIDTDYSFYNILFTMGQDAKIDITNSADVEIDENTNGRSHLTNCENEWEGIELTNQSSLKIHNTDIKNTVLAIKANVSSSLDIENSTITNSATGGIAIFDNAPMRFKNNTIDNTNLYGIIIINSATEYYEIDAPTINNIDVGINLNNASGAIIWGNITKSQRSILLNNSHGSTIEFNTLEYDLFGVQVYNSSTLSIAVNTIGVGNNYGNEGIELRNVNGSHLYNNTIRASRYGIRANHINALIDYNVIDVFGRSNTNSGGVSMTDATGVQLQNNYIDASSVAYGIESVDGVTNWIQNNDVTISSSLTMARSAAIRSMGSIDETIAQNITDSSNNADGILAQNSPMNHYDCNEIYDTHDGHGILFNCNFQEIQGNKYYNAHSLDFLIRSEVGIQNHEGNEYFGGKTRAYGLDVNELNNSRFLINGNIPSKLYLPTDPLPDNNQWYVEQNTTLNIYTCSGSPGPIWQPFNGVESNMCAYWSRIKQNRTLKPKKFFLRVLHLLKYESIRPGYSLPDCIKLDPLLMQECGLLEILDATVRIIETVKISDKNSHIQSSLDIIQAKQADYTSTQSKGNFDDIKAELLIAKPELTSEYADDQTELSAVDVALDNISCTRSQILDWKLTLKSYIDYLQDGLLNTSNMSSMNTISQQCSDEDGDFIHIARSLMSLDDAIYNDAYDGCLEDPANEIRSANVTGILELKVYPNPSNGNINLDFSTMVSGKYELVETRGSNIKTDFMNNTKQVNIDINVPDGIYIMKITLDTGERLSKKILIIN